jgi:hypothetical protein
VPSHQPKSSQREAAIIPLGRTSRHGSSNLPEGYRITNTRVSVIGVTFVFTKATHRAGPALPSYLVLHHAGFSVPRVLPRERWALAPPFHPYLRCVRYEDVSQVFLRDITELRFAGGLSFCGTFRDAPSGTGFSLCSPLRPLALPGALPFPVVPGRCPDFPPAQPSCDDQASDHPARPPTNIINHLRPTRCDRIRSTVVLSANR